MLASKKNTTASKKPEGAGLKTITSKKNTTASKKPEGAGLKTITSKKAMDKRLLALMIGLAGAGALGVRKALTTPQNYTKLTGDEDKPYHFYNVYRPGETLSENEWGYTSDGVNLKTNVRVTIQFQIKSKNTKSSSAMFRNEISLLRKIQGNNCSKYACIDGWGRVNGQYFIATKYIEGVDLNKFVREYKNLLTEEVFLKIGIQILDATTGLHDIGIAHMDIRPYNIIINPRTMDVNLIRFGTACNTFLCRGDGSVTFTPNHNKAMTKKTRMQLDYYALAITMVLFILTSGKIYGQKYMFVVNYFGVQVSDKILQFFQELAKLSNGHLQIV